MPARKQIKECTQQSNIKKVTMDIKGETQENHSVLYYFLPNIGIPTN